MRKNTYASPTLTVYGSVEDLTGISSGSGSGDVLFFINSGEHEIIFSPDEGTHQTCSYRNGSYGTLVYSNGPSEGECMDALEYSSDGYDNR